MKDAEIILEHEIQKKKVRIFNEQVFLGDLVDAHKRLYNKYLVDSGYVKGNEILEMMRENNTSQTTTKNLLIKLKKELQVLEMQLKRV